jgi:hypothetical protein
VASEFGRVEVSLADNVAVTFVVSVTPVTSFGDAAVSFDGSVVAFVTAAKLSLFSNAVLGLTATAVLPLVGRSLVPLVGMPVVPSLGIPVVKLAGNSAPDSKWSDGRVVALGAVRFPFLPFPLPLGTGAIDPVVAGPISSA